MTMAIIMVTVYILLVYCGWVPKTFTNTCSGSSTFPERDVNESNELYAIQGYT